MAFENIRQQQHIVRPDFHIEVLPGRMPRVIKMQQFDKRHTDHGGTDHRQEKKMRVGCIIAGAVRSIIDQSSGMGRC